jgi:hypothetical protein
MKSYFQDQSIIQLLEIHQIEGRIYCRLRRDAFSIVNGKNFDLVNDQHYLLLAGGTSIFVSQIGPHLPNQDRGVSEEMYWLADPSLTTQSPPEDTDFIYEGCNDFKICFGKPLGCLETRDCDLFGAVTYENNEFEFELLSSGKKILFLKIIKI